MGRPKQDLDARYGKLTVLAELSGNRVDVQCDCGQRKQVYRSNLRLGKVTSCGRPGCRTRTSSVLPPPHAGPSWVNVNHIREVWELYNGGSSASLLVTRFGLPGATDASVYNLIRAIRKKGGIDPYMASLYIPERDAVVPRPAPPPLSTAPVTTSFPAPPTTYKT